MVYIVITNLKRFLEDLEGTEVSTPNRPLFDAGKVALKESIAALEAYFLTPDAARCNKELICAAMDFSQKWETWIEGLGPGSLKHAPSKVFHEFLLRFFKGCVKAWRIWRIDLAKER